MLAELVVENLNQSICLSKRHGMLCTMLKIKSQKRHIIVQHRVVSFKTSKGVNALGHTKPLNTFRLHAMLPLNYEIGNTPDAVQNNICYLPRCKPGPGTKVCFVSMLPYNRNKVRALHVGSSNLIRLDDIATNNTISYSLYMWALNFHILFLTRIWIHRGLNWKSKWESTKTMIMRKRLQHMPRAKRCSHRM